ncbi:MAG TPA: hypothetical protein VGH89_39125, partial [Pseudonocardia sp.]
MIDQRFADVLVKDSWEAIGAEVREEFLARRVASGDPGAFGGREPDGARWVPLRPVILEERAYRLLESIVARL